MYYSGLNQLKKLNQILNLLYVAKVPAFDWLSLNLAGWEDLFSMMLIDEKEKRLGR